MKKVAMILVLASCILLSGCSYFAPVIPPQGWFYANISAPIDVDSDSTHISNKSGESTSRSILNLFAWGNASTAAAAANANLQKIEYVDYNYFNVLFVYQSFTIRAYGE